MKKIFNVTLMGSILGLSMVGCTQCSFSSTKQAESVVPSQEASSTSLTPTPTPASTSTTATENATVSSFQNISNDELKDLLAKGVTIVDIRRSEEWKSTGVVANSKQITLFDGQGKVNPSFMSELQTVAPIDKPVILICRTGNRTREGSKMLINAGYKTVYNVTHGIKGWMDAGFAVVTINN